VKHLALWNLSRKRNTPFNFSALGDKVHGLFCAYQYAEQNNTSVTLHINRRCQGDTAESLKHKSKQQMASWNEVHNLFPADKINIQFWDFPISSDKDILKYLKNNNIDADLWYYRGDHIDIVRYFKNKVLLKSNIINNTPEKLITMQWDSNDSKRNINPVKVNDIKKYYTDKGYGIIEIGSRQSLEQIGCYLSKAYLHVGVESGMMHMAAAYMPYNKIHVYTGKWFSGHVNRAIDCGTKINYLWEKGLK
tara:strand:+ start:970 stop:1716 length:747 start_codon:yes stop_codon:yes gene_type:complete